MKNAEVDRMVWINKYMNEKGEVADRINYERKDAAFFKAIHGGRIIRGFVKVNDAEVN